MEYRPLGRSGIKVAPLALGTFNFGGPTNQGDSVRIIARAIDAGINLFDVANSYNEGRSEAILGRAIKEHANRDDILLATKVHYPVGTGPNDSGNSRLHIMRECDRSLKRLGVEYIDLYQLHRPDFEIGEEEALSALNDLVQQGKVRYIGTSTHPSWKVMEGLGISERRGWARYIVEQPPYNLLDRRVENELVPLCLKHGMSLIPYAPLAQGVLAGRYTSKADLPSDSRAVVRGGAYADRVNDRGISVGIRLSEIAEEYDIPTSQLAMAWIKDRPAVAAPLFGPRTMEQLEDMLPVLELQFPRELEAAFDLLVPPGSAVTNFHNGCRWQKQVLEINA